MDTMKPIAEKAENHLAEWRQKRELIEIELQTIHAEMKKTIDKIFEDINHKAEETDDRLGQLCEKFKFFLDNE